MATRSLEAIPVDQFVAEHALSFSVVRSVVLHLGNDIAGPGRSPGTSSPSRSVRRTHPAAGRTHPRSGCHPNDEADVRLELGAFGESVRLWNVMPAWGLIGSGQWPYHRDHREQQEQGVAHGLKVCNGKRAVDEGFLIEVVRCAAQLPPQPGPPRRIRSSGSRRPEHVMPTGLPPRLDVHAASGCSCC